MAWFVALHGAWHWGGCFQKLGVALAGRGHAMVAPDLAGHGFDATPRDAITSMAIYTAAARRVIEAAPAPVVLVGHSLGGASASYLAEALAGRIAGIVYVAGFMLPAGRTSGDYTPKPDHPGALLMKLVSFEQAGMRLNRASAADLHAALYQDCSPQDSAIALANLIDIQPWTPALTPCPVTAGRFGRLPRLYIECLDDRAIPLAAQRVMQTDSPGAEVASLPGGHSPFIADPETMADMLDRFALRIETVGNGRR